MAAAQAAADRQAILARQHQVENQQVKVFALPQFAHFLGIFGHEYIEPLFRQIAAQEIAQSGIIVDDQDLAGRSGVLRVHGRKCNSDKNQRLVGVHKILHIARYG
ncbi:Uncharacterised protein [Bordetella pertussis]|nr:Uncharacterised protein [Bordetella pertussis]CFU82611.1 Uncharacterised protein [Bordetella pertussis]CPI08993.1 Uncharacterised protein [Bordetella pertussis]CPL72623.1 Uncharacterised protein [Bordetella pertussis]